MGAVSTRGAWRERRLVKRNSPLYGPHGALPSAQLFCPRSRRWGPRCLFAPVWLHWVVRAPGSATGGSMRYGPVPDAAISGWRNCFLLRFWTRPRKLNATDWRGAVNSPLTCPFMYRRRSEPFFGRESGHGRALCVAELSLVRVSRAGPLRRTAPARSARSAGTGDPCPYPVPAAAACVRGDPCSRTGPCRLPPGP
jgi:hypothetical protein